MRLAVYRSGMPIDTVDQRRAAYLGSVGAGFNIENLMKDVIDEKLLRYMRFTLYDAGLLFDRPDFLLLAGSGCFFDSIQFIQDSPTRPAADDPSLTFAHVLRSRSLAGSGRSLSAHQKKLLSTRGSLLPSIVLIAGLLATLLLSESSIPCLLRAIAPQARCPETKDLRETEERSA